MDFNQYKSKVLYIFDQFQNIEIEKSLLEELIYLNKNCVLGNINLFQYSEYEDEIFKVLKLQYFSTKKAYDLGYIKIFEYERFNNFYKLEELKSQIRDYLDLLIGKEYYYTDIFNIISILENVYINESIFNLTNDYIDKIFLLFNRIYDSLSSDKISKPEKIAINKEIRRLSDEFLSLGVGINRSLLEQTIKIDIKKISKDFSIEDIDFIAKKNQNFFNKKMLSLNNNHIVSLDINETIYGLSGLLNFELAYKDNHPDFKFLFDENQLLLLDIKILDKFAFLKKEENENIIRQSRFIAVGNINNDYSTSKFVDMNTISDIGEKFNFIKVFQIKFNDPLKILWGLHKPNYIDFDKSVEDLIQDNFFFENICSIDTSNCQNIKEKMPQAFVSTVGRDFYDFFIEQLYLNNCAIKYFCDNDSDTPKYYIAEKFSDSFKQSFKNMQENIKQSFDRLDLNNITKLKINSIANSNMLTQNHIIPDINFSEKRKIEFKDDSNFSQLYETTMEPLNYKNLKFSEKEKPKAHSWIFNVYSKSNFVYCNSQIDLSKIDNKLDNEKYLINIDGLESIYLLKKHIRFVRCLYTSKQVHKNINDLSYKDDSDPEVYEKIVCCGSQRLTHVNDYIFYYGDYDRQMSEYPTFKKYHPFDIIGKIIIAKEVDEAFKKAYKFFEDFKLNESCFRNVQEGNEAGTSIINNSKDDIFYAVEIPQEILFTDCEKDSIIFVPVKININSSSTNQFLALRNDDIVLINFKGIKECNISELISNSAISYESTQDKMLQQQYLGAKENCIVAYTEEQGKETYSIQQINKKNDCHFLINNEKGISIIYKAKEE